MSKTKSIVTLILAFSCFASFSQSIIAQDEASLRVSLQSRIPSAERGVAPGTLVIHQEIQHWTPKETAIIVCDMWEQHWCKGAAARTAEMALHMNEVLSIARKKGITIVHAPSDTVASWYQAHPARKRAQAFLAPEIEQRLGRGIVPLPTETNAVWPLDQSDGGCDCVPNCPSPSGPPYPWKHQIETLAIDDEDLISESGVEIGSYFEEKGIKNVILMGMHTNMCIIWRSFGLRNMVRLGKNVVLMRDMTDPLYNSKKAPFVSRFTGNSLMQQYIESYICPSMVSTDFTGKKQFRFKEDIRPRVAFITAEHEYQSNRRFHEFAHELLLTKGVNCDFAVGDPDANSPGRHNIENLQILEDADIVFLSVRRRALEAEKMNAVKKYVASGKTFVGIRTASHAFSLRERLPEGLVTWDELDRDVFGGNYTNHLSRDSGGTRVEIVPGMEGHPLLEGINPAGFSSPSWLYNVRPLRSPTVQVLLTGTATGTPPEPVLWINHLPNGRIIYTSLGHGDDWEIPDFKRLMMNITDSNLP